MTNLFRSCCVIGLTSAALWAAADERPSAQATPARPTAGARPPATVGTWQPTRRKDGQPDIEGIYQATGNEGGSGTNIEPMPGMMGTSAVSPGIVIDPPDGKIPYLPWARVRR